MLEYKEGLSASFARELVALCYSTPIRPVIPR